MSTSTPITLDFPIDRGTSKVDKITLHKPNAGQLRGVSLRELLDMNTDAIVKVVSRVSEPQITPQEAAGKLDPSDLLQIGAALANFLLPPALKEQAEAEVSALQSQTV